MTLKPYSAEMLDQFALRLLDLAALMRGMAQKSRENEMNNFAVHDKKAREWIENIERWALRSQADLDLAVIEERATRRASGAVE